MKRAVTESVTLVRKGAPTGAYDSQGYPVISADSELLSRGWKVAARSSAESALNFGQVVVTGITIYNRAQVEVLTTDGVKVRGESWAVDGDVAAWRNGVIVNLKRAS